MLLHHLPNPISHFHPYDRVGIGASPDAAPDQVAKHYEGTSRLTLTCAGEHNPGIVPIFFVVGLLTADSAGSSEILIEIFKAGQRMAARPSRPNEIATTKTKSQRKEFQGAQHEL